ncbi:hypothetical protein [Endozoicomonas lisbonensis]|uniref:Sulfatase N-terminal domain-containing protein n=1 Tax=Endozoicomonas lisbonensis TaxID=3120522 RepID=A0ABV2SAZ5_9GAMM
MCKFFDWTVVVSRASLPVMGATLLPFFSGQAYPGDKPWQPIPGYTQPFYPIAFPGASGKPDDVSVIESSQLIPTLNDEGQPVLLQSQRTEQVPYTGVGETLNNYFTYPITHTAYSVRGRDYRVTTVGGSGYPRFNFMLTRQDMRKRHQYIMERAESEQEYIDVYNTVSHHFSSFSVSSGFAEGLKQGETPETVYDRFFGDRGIARHFYDDSGRLTEDTERFWRDLYRPLSDALPKQSSRWLRDEPQWLGPDFISRADILARNTVENRSDVLNITQTTADELNAIMDSLNAQGGVTAWLVSASQHGVVRTSLDDVITNLWCFGDDGDTWDSIITDAFISINHGEGRNGPPAPRPVTVTEITGVEPVAGFSRNLNLPAAIVFPNEQGIDQLLLISSLTEPADNTKSRDRAIKNINLIQNQHPNTAAILTNYTYKSGTQDKERTALMRMRPGGKELRENAMASFYLGMGDELYSSSNVVLKAWIALIMRRHGVNLCKDFRETRKKPDTDDGDGNSGGATGFNAGRAGITPGSVH